MNLLNALTKFVSQFTNPKEKEVSKMTKKILIVSVTLLAFLANVVPAAHAYTYSTLATPVSVSATGIVSGNTIAFTVSSVLQGTGAAGAIDFGTSPVGFADSGEALKIKGGTNQVNNRLIIYTDNNTNTTLPNKAPTGDPATGVDGSGLVGQTDPAQTVALFWGCDTTANNSPNTDVDYAFGNPQVPVDGGSGNCTYIVDVRHTMSFTAVNSTLDNAPLFTLAGTSVTNTAGDGLYPQLWDSDLYSSATVHTTATKVSPSLYSTIATVMFNIGPVATGTDNGFFVGTMPQIKTYDGIPGSVKSGDVITARLSKTDATAGGELYLAIGGDFNGKPAQTYSTAKLFVALVQN